MTPQTSKVNLCMHTDFSILIIIAIVVVAADPVTWETA